MRNKQKNLVLFMTWDVSLSLWKEKGLLQREVKLYQALAKKGINVTFLSWGGSEDREVAEALLPEITTLSLYNHLPRPKSKALRALVSLLVPFALRRELKQAEIYKTNQLWGGWVAALSALILQKPLIARCGFELYDFTVRQNHSLIRQKFIWLISRFTYGVATRICVATQEDKDVVIKEFKQKSEKISLHPNWIDTDFFTPQEVAKKENHILFVGRLSEQKNLPRLFEAMVGTGITLDIIGKGELKSALQAQADRIGIKVNFGGVVPNDKLPALYNSYPAYVLASDYEGNPKTLLEAMACGCAVIGTDVSGISSVIDHEKSGLLSAPNVTALRETIKYLMSAPDLRKSLGERARAQIVEDQTLDKLIDKELACYDLIEERK